MNKDNEILSVIKFLMSEVEGEMKNNEVYEKVKVEAEEKANEYNKSVSSFVYKKYYWDFMPEDVRRPKKSVINNNLKKIRQLCLKLYQ